VIIQSITLLWTKEVRGAPFSTLRNQYYNSFSLPELMIEYKEESRIPFHELYITQNRNGFEIRGNKVNYLDSFRSDWRIGCVEIKQNDDLLLIHFEYSDYCGKPIRYDNRNNYLSEKAFVLYKNEYGRIIYNGRLVHSDTGEWIYQIHVLNIYNAHTNKKEILVTKKPDKEYKQVVVLF